MTTSDPGTDVTVTNSGTAEAAVLDFSIPRGATGATGDTGATGATGATGPTGTIGTLDTLVAVNTPEQTTTTSGALTFADTPVVSGSSIAHTGGSADVTVSENGIYLVSFHGTAAADTSASPPVTLTLTLNADSTPVPGGVISQNFGAADEEEALSFTVAVQVTSAPSTFQVIADQENISMTDMALSFVRLGN